MGGWDRARYKDSHCNRDMDTKKGRGDEGAREGRIERELEG